MQVGRQLEDPRSTGLGLVLLTWIGVISTSFAEALEYSEPAWRSRSEWTMAVSAKGNALVGLRRTDEAGNVIERFEHGKTNAKIHFAPQQS